MRPLKADMAALKAPLRTPAIEDRGQRIIHLMSVIYGLVRSPSKDVRELGTVLQTATRDLERLNDIALLIANKGDDESVSLWLQIDNILKQD